VQLDFINSPLVPNILYPYILDGHTDIQLPSWKNPLVHA